MYILATRTAFIIRFGLMFLCDIVCMAIYNAVKEAWYCPRILCGSAVPYYIVKMVQIIFEGYVYWYPPQSPVVDEAPNHTEMPRLTRTAVSQTFIGSAHYEEATATNSPLNEGATLEADECPQTPTE
jgi:hypothetical protein